MISLLPAIARLLSAIAKLQWHCLWIVVMLVSLTGCINEGEFLDRTYGKQSGIPGRDSVNGTAVLADMFRQAGHKVSTKRELTPSIQDADVLVWFPDDFHAPSEETVTWLEKWLYWHDGGILIYVGRDFDASLPYWEAVIPQTPKPTDSNTAGSDAEESSRAKAAPVVAESEITEMKKRQDEQTVEYRLERAVMGESVESAWYRYENGSQRRPITTLSGPWSEGVDAAAAQIEVHGTMTAGTFEYDERQVLLSSGDDELVVRFTTDSKYHDGEDVFDFFDGFEAPDWEGEDIRESELILITNGSFLLNAPLVNHENRKLAGKLIERCAGRKKIVFLESDASGLPLKKQEPPPEVPSSLMVLTVWPINIILVHLAIVGIVFCFVRGPIFGRPRLLPVARLTDFGHHIAALGTLLAQTGDQRYAREKLAAYHQSQSGEAAKAPPASGSEKAPAASDSATASGSPTATDRA